MVAARETLDRPASFPRVFVLAISDSSLADHRAAAPRDKDQHVMYCL